MSGRREFSTDDPKPWPITPTVRLGAAAFWICTTALLAGILGFLLGVGTSI